MIGGGAIYLRAVSVVFFLTGISQIYLCTLKNTGKATTKYSVISSVSVVISIVLNAVLIFGLFGVPKLEIAGAALAAVIARIIKVVWCILETRKNRVKLKLYHFLHGGKLLRHDF